MPVRWPVKSFGFAGVPHPLVFKGAVFAHSSF
jgi:hypothetical protein